MPSQSREAEIERASDNLIRDASSPNEKMSIENKMVEWKKVQALLSNMGLQLIHSNSKTKLEEKSITAKKKRATRELQSLNFNVSYDRGSCSNGKKNSL